MVKHMGERFIEITFIIVFFAGCFTACSSDDDGSSATASKVKGVWSLTNSKGSECGDSWDEKIPTSFTDGAYRVTFNSDGTFFAERYYEDDGWERSSRYLEYSSGKYEVADGILYLRGSYDAVLYKIKSFSGSKMVLHTDWDDCDEPCWVDLTFTKKK